MRESKAGDKNQGQEAQRLRAHQAKSDQVSSDLAGRKAVDGQLEKAGSQWRQIFDAIRDSIMLLDNEFKIIQANIATSGLLGRPLDEIVGKTCWRLFHNTDQAPQKCPLRRAKRTKKHEETEIHIPEKDIYIGVSVNPMLDDRGNVIRAVHIIRDITRRKKTEQLLRKERDISQKYLDVAGVVLIAIDPEQRVGFINKKGCEILGYKEGEILAKNWFDNFLPGRVRQEVKTVFERMIAGEVEAPEYYENPILTKSGEERLIAWHNTILRDEKGNVIATLSSGEDITERNRAEQKLHKYQSQLKSLASRLVLAEEQERRRLAIALHDQTSQSLSLSKIRLEALRQSVSGDDTRKVLEEVCNLLGQTIENTRSLTLDLSSSILYELDFETAVEEWLSEQIQKKHGIKTEFKDDGQTKPLDDDIRVLLFRNVRELLVNVVKHAQAKKVKVTIRKMGNRIRVDVEDDGVGFDPDKITYMPAGKCGFGLFSIRERLEQLDGHLEIKSQPGQGTKITMMAPLKG